MARIDKRVRVDRDFLVEYLLPEEVDPTIKRRIKEIYPLLENGVALDAGCGSGWMSRALMRMGFDVISLDVDPLALRASKIASELTMSPTKLIRASIIHLPFRSGVMGSVIASEVLEHIPNIEGVILEIARVLKKRGILAFTVPSRVYALTSDMLGKAFTIKHSRHWRWSKIQSEVFYSANEKGSRAQHHVHSFTPGLIVKLLKKGEFQIIVFKNLYFLANLISALFLGLFGLKRRHIKGLLELDLEISERAPKHLAGSYVIVCRKGSCI